MSTKDRILITATNLFNEHGTAAISTNHIAEACKMSPGNLYYHFRSKEDIIRLIFERLFDAWDKRFALPKDRPPTVADGAELVRTNFTIMWEFRFIYRELLPLLRQDEALRERFIVVRQRGYTGFSELIAAWSAMGLITVPIPPATVTKLADIIWLISEFWLATLEISGEDVTEAQLQRGIDLMLHTLEPYMK